jgi:hypothetical protein
VPNAQQHTLCLYQHLLSLPPHNGCSYASVCLPLQGEVDIVSPMALGGFGSEQYLAANPQNKVR